MDIYTKDPDATLDFAIDWSANLVAGDTIIGATWTVPAGLTQPSTPVASVVGAKAIVWLAGGTVGQVHSVGCRIVTAQGRIDERAIIIRISER